MSERRRAKSAVAYCNAAPGFTLVELLVVIGIIALLISILLPALNKARQQAEEVQDMSNLKQWGIAMQMYADANGGLLPSKGAKGYDVADIFGPSNSTWNPTTGAQAGKGVPIVGIDDSTMWENALPMAMGQKSLYQRLVDAKNGKGTAPGPHVNDLFVDPSADSVAAYPGSGDVPSADGQAFMYWIVDSQGQLAPAGTQVQYPIYMAYDFNSQLLSGTGSAKTYAYTPVKMSTCRPAQCVVMMMDKAMNYGEFTDPTVVAYFASHPSLTGASTHFVAPQNATAAKPAGYNSDLSQPLGDPKRFTTRHNHGGNIMFADGHVEFFSWVDVQGNLGNAGAPSVSATDYDINNYSKLIWSPVGVDLY